MSLRESYATLVTRLLGPERLSFWHYGEAMRQYQKANAELAIRHLRSFLALRPEHWVGWLQLSVVYSQLIGDIEESHRLLRYARSLRERQHTPTGGKPPYCMLDYRWAAHIGHIANMEHIIKRELLRGSDAKKIILYFPETLAPANRTLLDKMGAHIDIVRSEQHLPIPHDAMLSVLEEYYICESLDGQTKHWWHASSEVFKAWEEAGRAPLLTLTEPEIARTRTSLRALGMPDNAWFVCLHVRESGFKQEQGYGTVEAVLNAEIETYLPAIRAITERGGWVVRVGDAKMRPLPALPQTIDYAHSRAKADWMDVFLLGACRFFIGTSSGPAYIPPLFGVPCVLTNWAPTGQRPFNPRDLYIQKRYRIGALQRELSFAETMAPPIGYAPRYALAEAIGLVAVPNSPEEIREVVVEMLERLEGKARYSEEDKLLQSAFDVVAETNLCIGNARPGREFLRRHRNLLMNAEHAAA